MKIRKKYLFPAVFFVFSFSAYAEEYVAAPLTVKFETEMLFMAESGDHGFRVVCQNAPDRVILIREGKDAFDARENIDTENRAAGRNCWASWLGYFRLLDP